MTGKKLRAAILDTCFYVPEEIITNEFFEGLTLRDDKTGELTLKTSNEWITQMMGVKERRKSAPDEYASDMAVKAANKMFENSHLTPADLDGIVVATSTPDRGFPPTANLLQKGIRAERDGQEFRCRTDIFADDLGSACASFLAAVDYGKCRIESGDARYVLVMASETLTKIVDYTNSNCPIFGDGAAGFILGPEVEGRGFLSVVRKNDPYRDINSIYKGIGKWAGPRKEIIEPGDGFNNPSTLRMPHGPRVMKTAIREMVSAIKQAVENAGWNLSEVDLAICHQANIRISEGIQAQLPSLQIYNNIHRYGNMSGVTCPACFHEAKQEGLVKDGSKIVFAAFGSGEKTYSFTHQF